MAKIKHVEIRIFTEVLSIIYGPHDYFPVTNEDAGINEYVILDALWMEREKSRYPEYVIAYCIMDDGTECDYLEMYSSRADYLKQHSLFEVVRPAHTPNRKRNLYSFAWSDK